MRLGSDTLLTASLRNASPSFLAFKVAPSPRVAPAGVHGCLYFQRWLCLT